MKRREFITLFGGAAVSWPPAARAQAPARRPLIAILVGGTPETATFLSGFRERMNALGYEGRNYDIVLPTRAGTVLHDSTFEGDKSHVTLRCLGGSATGLSSHRRLSGRYR
jgi:hypothetical protein